MKTKNSLQSNSGSDIKASSSRFLSRRQFMMTGSAAAALSIPKFRKHIIKKQLPGLILILQVSSVSGQIRHGLIMPINNKKVIWGKGIEIKRIKENGIRFY